MLNRSNSWALVLLACCVPSIGQMLDKGHSGTESLSSLTGVWRGTADNLPAVELTITDEAGSLSGAVLFYLHVRKTPADAYTVTPGVAEPLLDLKFDGRTLNFQISHRRAHPPRTLQDPPISFHLTVTSRDHAELVNEKENQRLPLVRAEY